MQNQTRKTQIKTSNSKKADNSTGTIRINLTISKTLLEKVDEAALLDYTNRSDIIRQALLWYLRPQGRELDQTDPEVILRTLQKRKAKAELNKIAKELDLNQ